MWTRLAAIIVPLSSLMAAIALRGEARAAAVAVCAASSVLVVMGLLNPQSRLFGRSLAAPSTRPRVALTFDDGPHPVDTPAILEILEKAGARATFFFVGERARNHPDLVRRVAASGHEIEAHSQTHPWCFSLLPASRTRQEVRESVKALDDLAGRRPRFFRPPMGHKSLSLERVLREEGLQMVTWSARPFDTLGRSAEAILANLLRKARPGGILILHEGLSRRGTEISPSVQVLPRLLDGLRRKGLEPVPLQDLLEVEP